MFLSGSSGGRTQLKPIARRLRPAARSVAAPRIVVTAMIEQPKRKGPELPLVPVKRPRHELLLGATGSGPGAGQQQATPGALLQAVSGRHPDLALHSSRYGPYWRCGNGKTLNLMSEQDCKVVLYSASVSYVFPCWTPVFSLPIAL